MKYNTEKWIMPSINAPDVMDLHVSKQHTQELERIKKKFEEAEKAGFEQGYKSGKQLIDQQLSVLQQIVTNFEKPLDNIESELYDMLIKLVEKSIRFILRNEVQSDISKLKNVVEKMLLEVKDKKNGLEIFLNPDDLVKLQKMDLLTQLGIPIDMFKPTDKLSHGEIKIESDNMIYNATVQSCIEQLFHEKS